MNDLLNQIDAKSLANHWQITGLGADRLDALLKVWQDTATDNLKHRSLFQ